MSGSNVNHWPRAPSVNNALTARDSADGVRGQLEQLREKHPVDYAYASARLIAELNRADDRQRYALT